MVSLLPIQILTGNIKEIYWHENKLSERFFCYKVCFVWIWYSISLWFFSFLRKIKLTNNVQYNLWSECKTGPWFLCLFMEVQLWKGILILCHCYKEKDFLKILKYQFYLWCFAFLILLLLILMFSYLPLFQLNFAFCL